MLARDIDVSGSFQFQPFSLQIYIFPSKDYQIQAFFLNDFILKRCLIYLKFTALINLVQNSISFPCQNGNLAAKEALTKTKI